MADAADEAAAPAPAEAGRRPEAAPEKAPEEEETAVVSSPQRRDRLTPREWIAGAVALLTQSPAGGLAADAGGDAARLHALAARARALRGPLPDADRAELSGRLDAIEGAVRLHAALAAAVESTRPEIEAARAFLCAAGRPVESP